MQLTLSGNIQCSIFERNYFNYSISATTNTGPKWFIPLPAFDSPNGKVTLISILPQNVVYLKPSSDLIFYASYHFKGDSFEFWMRMNQLASTLACIDENEVCHGKRCWSSLLDALNWLDANRLVSHEVFLNIILLITALEHSTIYVQLVDNYENALQIKSLLSHSGASLGTADWRVEAEGFFQSSLAYLQNDIVNIANGAFHDVPGTFNLLKSLGDWSGICDMVLVTASGFKSVSLRGLIAIILLSLLVAIFSINPDEELVVIGFVTRTTLKLISLVGKLANFITGLVWEAMTWVARRRRNRLPRSVTFVRILNVPIQRRR
jgi:hypothetical protein